MSDNKKTKILCILDGFGLSPKNDNNINSLAKMPNFRKLLKENYWTTLNADGEMVGQEEGLVGNSEVGHMNIGGLKLVPQLSFQITKSSESGFEINKNLAPDQLFDPSKFLRINFTNSNKVIHLIGLFSTGTIHSDMRHWVGMIEASLKAGAEKIVLHLMTDGRDSDKKSLVASWEIFEKMLTEKMSKNENVEKFANWQNKIFLGSVGGRFYGMDRDKNWDRVARGMLPMFESSFWLESSYLNSKITSFLKEKYNLDKPVFTDTINNQTDNSLDNYFETTRYNYDFETKTVAKNGFPFDLLSNFDHINNLISNYAEISYKKSIYDEHILPQSFTENFEEKFQIQKNDSVCLINFRSDRMKQFTQMFCDINSEFDLNLNILALNDYGDGNAIEFENAELETENKKGYYPIFKSQAVQGTLAEVISKMEKKADKEKVIQLAQILWNYGKLNEKTEKSDLILAFGNNELGVAKQAANLYLQGFAPKILFTGKGVAFETSEAEEFAKVAMEMGVPSEDIWIENRSMNTGENIKFSCELLQKLDFKPKKIITVSKPFGERRNMATLQVQWPDKNTQFYFSSEEISLENYLQTDFEKKLNLLVKMVNRMKVWGEAGFQTPQEIPSNVWQAYLDLVAIGFDKRLVKEERKGNSFKEKWQGIIWEGSNFKFIQLGENSTREMISQHNIWYLQKDLEDHESWLYNNIEMAKDKTRLDFFCLENEQYLGLIQLEKMGANGYELFVGCEEQVSDLGRLLKQFSELVFANLGIESIHFKQTHEYFEKYKILVEAVGFKFEKTEIETGCVYSIKNSQKEENQILENYHNSTKFCTQLHIAETEKYNHVTYFLNGGQDKKWDGEEWIVIPSNKVNGHNEKPEMKAKEVTDKLLEVLGGEEFIYQQDKTTQNLEFKDRPTTKSIIYNPKTNKYLWHKNVNNLFIDTNFALIGGGIKQNETVEEGLFRKLKTEAGLDKNELESINLLGKTNLKYEFVVDKRWHANIVVGNLETDKNFNINQLNYIFYIETWSEKTDVEEDSCISKWLSKEEILADENNLSLEARFLLENLDKLKKESEEVENNAVFLNQSNKLVFEKNPFLKGSEQSEGGFLTNQIQIPYNPELKEKASQMRQDMTKAESLVWNIILKDDQTGYRFIRQKPLLNYIVDFYCHKLGLIIEIDGESHNYQLDYDAQRSQKLTEYNLQVLRISNSDVYSNLEGVKLHIEQVIKEIENNEIHSSQQFLGNNKITQNHIQQAVKKSDGDKIPQNLKILTPLKRGDDVQNIQSYASKRGDDTGNSWSGTTSNNFITTEVEPNLYQIKTLETYEKFGLEYIKVSGDEFIDQNGDLIVDKKMKVWLEQALNKLKPEAKILEIGSGSGADSDYMESKGFTVYRTDAAESFIKYQQNLGKKITKLNLLEDFELTDKYDLIYASKVLGHFTKRQVREILLKLKNNLTASGLLAINVKLGTKPAKFNDYLDIGGELYKDFWNEEGFEKVLAELDFEIKYAQKSDSDVWLNLILSQKKQYDYIIVNYANPDMVGHTGDIPASIASMEFLDEQLGRLIETVERGGHEMIIIADHGNIEFVGEFVKNGQKLTDTEHNANPVPCVFVGNGWKVGDQTKLENQKIKLLENLTNLKTKGFCSPDVDLVAKVLSQQNQVNLENPENWLTKEQIENIRPQLSLWYSGVLLLGLGE
jgi:bisphosphoglycerate-independent phosphoglycerate mutase (AlkP superfamily)/very-short-patch-repair endonuclease/uncharacterized SAM-binding protein YcdF (DUF218 family)/ADP-ribose pyrophosphatase YjhB (NUDIX family)